MPACGGYIFQTSVRYTEEWMKLSLVWSRSPGNLSWCYRQPWSRNILSVLLSLPSSLTSITISSPNTAVETVGASWIALPIGCEAVYGQSERGSQWASPLGPGSPVDMTEYEQRLTSPARLMRQCSAVASSFSLYKHPRLTFYIFWCLLIWQTPFYDTCYNPNTAGGGSQPYPQTTGSACAAARGSFAYSQWFAGEYFLSVFLWLGNLS